MFSLFDLFTVVALTDFCYSGFPVSCRSTFSAVGCTMNFLRSLSCTFRYSNRMYVTAVTKKVFTIIMYLSTEVINCLHDVSVQLWFTVQWWFDQYPSICRLRSAVLEWTVRECLCNGRFYQSPLFFACRMGRKSPSSFWSVHHFLRCVANLHLECMSFWSRCRWSHVDSIDLQVISANWFWHKQFMFRSHQKFVRRCISSPSGTTDPLVRHFGWTHFVIDQSNKHTQRRYIWSSKQILEMEFCLRVALWIWREQI